jgi:peroxiredoxin
MRRLLLASLLFSAIAPITFHAQAKPVSEYDIQDEFKALASGKGASKPQPGGLDMARGDELAKIAAQINTLPAGQKKVNFAVQLAEYAAKGDPGKENIQTVVDTLSAALIETPGSGKKDKPSAPYMELARFVRYAGMTTKVTDPQLADAEAVLAGYDADIQKADFTLPTLDGKKITLSALKGKIVLVNFFAVSCGSCQAEMRDLNLIYEHFQSQGLVIMSLSPEPLKEVGNMAGHLGITYPIVFDTFRKAMEQFHVDTVPRTFVFDRDGKLVAQSIDAVTQGQLFRMLARAGLKPQ